MERKLDVVATVCAVGVAAYAAIAIGHVARHHLGFSLHEIRSAATVIAGALAALIGIDLFGKKLRKAK